MIDKSMFDTKRVYEAEVACSGLIYWSDDRKKRPIRAGNFGDYAIFSIVQQKRRARGTRAAYIPARAFGAVLEQVRDIPRGSFVRITGTLDNAKGFHIKVKTVEVIEKAVGGTMDGIKAKFKDIERDFLSGSLMSAMQQKLSEFPGTRQNVLDGILFEGEPIPREDPVKTRERARQNLISLALSGQPEYLAGNEPGGGLVNRSRKEFLDVPFKEDEDPYAGLPVVRKKEDDREQQIRAKKKAQAEKLKNRKKSKRPS